MKPGSQNTDVLSCPFSNSLILHIGLYVFVNFIVVSVAHLILSEMFSSALILHCHTLHFSVFFANTFFLLGWLLVSVLYLQHTPLYTK